MKGYINLLKSLSDPLRLRIVILLGKKELCVCQLMGVTGASQPLISRNLSILKQNGLLEERRKGKLRFYRLNRKVPRPAGKIIRALEEGLSGDDTIERDLRNLKECTEFQKKTGRCDMKTFQEFMKKQRTRGGKK
jgi:ArsR family transcriptional regulator